MIKSRERYGKEEKVGSSTPFLRTCGEKCRRHGTHQILSLFLVTLLYQTREIGYLSSTSLSPLSLHQIFYSLFTLGTLTSMKKI